MSFLEHLGYLGDVISIYSPEQGVEALKSLSDTQLLEEAKRLYPIWISHFSSVNLPYHGNELASRITELFGDAVGANEVFVNAQYCISKSLNGEPVIRDHLIRFVSLVQEASKIGGEIPDPVILGSFPDALANTPHEPAQIAGVESYKFLSSSVAGLLVGLVGLRIGLESSVISRPLLESELRALRLELSNIQPHDNEARLNLIKRIGVVEALIGDLDREPSDDSSEISYAEGHTREMREALRRINELIYQFRLFGEDVTVYDNSKTCSQGRVKTPKPQNKGTIVLEDPFLGIHQGLSHRKRQRYSKELECVKGKLRIFKLQNVNLDEIPRVMESVGSGTKYIFDRQFVIPSNPIKLKEYNSLLEHQERLEKLLAS
jgi:hypothetical protein